MGCCWHEDHDYCCACTENVEERAEHIIEDILDGTYRGEVDIPDFTKLPSKTARIVADAIVAVLNHEDAI